MTYFITQPPHEISKKDDDLETFCSLLTSPFRASRFQNPFYDERESERFVICALIRGFGTNETRFGISQKPSRIDDAGS